MLFLTSHGTMNFYDARLALEDVLVFGNEETGFSAELRTQIVGSDYRLPMPEASARCLNLSTAVAVATWELLRQTGELANP